MKKSSNLTRACIFFLFYFEPRDTMLAWLLAMAPCLCLCLCLSQVGVLSKGVNIDWAWGLLPTSPALCYKDQVSTNIRYMYFPLELFPKLQTSPYRSSIRIIILAHERWVLRAWWTCCRSTEPPPLELRWSTTVVYLSDRQALSAAWFCVAVCHTI